MAWGVVIEIVKRLVSTRTGLYATIGAVALGASFYGGYWLADTQNEKSRIEAVERAIKEANDIASQDAEILAEREDVRVEVRTVYKTIYRDAENVQTDCSDLGAEFVSVFNAAIKAGETEAR